ncbi:MAG: efflux RND transporter periplasmic adaptor subunit [bacterium]|nr:efflux RND transporter periplasmic adaptor subunit [bacterium]
MEKAKNLILKWPWITGLIIVAGVGGLLYFTRTKTPASVDYSVVERGTVSQVVSVTGYVKPSSAVNLSFEKSGRISAVYARVGDIVGVGDALVALNGSDITAQLAQAQANTKVQAAKLSELENGARPEDILVSEVDVENAKNDVANDIKSGYVNSDDAIRNKVDQLFSNPRGSSPQFNFTISNSQLKSDMEVDRQRMESLLVSWNADIAGVAWVGDVTALITETKGNLVLVQNFLDLVSFAVNALQPSSTVSQTTIDGYKAAVLSGRTNISTSLDNITASQEKLRTAESKLALKKAGTVKEQIDAQEAEVESAEASAMNLQAQLAKTVIRSPIAGIVTKQDAKAGEIASAGVVLTSVISDAKYEIEANVAEADIAKIKIGNEAQVTLDAYGNDVVFTAMVTSIGPAETIIDGVPTYKTTLQFKGNDQRIKSGMTANTDISGAKRDSVLFIPGRAISGRGAAKTVNALEGETVREVTVETGLRGSNGDVEILSGLAEGDKVKAN